jgi:hypothetical protein
MSMADAGVPQDPTSTRLSALEEHVHQVMTPELRANTILTRQVHEAMFGRGEDVGVQANVQGLHEALFGPDADPLPGIERLKGVQQKVDEMYAGYEFCKNGIRLLGKLGNGAMSVSDTIERRPKTILTVILSGAVTWGFSTTGKLPEWIQQVVKLLLA